MCSVGGTSWRGLRTTGLKCTCCSTAHMEVTLIQSSFLLVANLFEYEEHMLPHKIPTCVDSHSDGWFSNM